ncbi:MAG: hypothetical protein CL693_04230 [Cellvibrionaceae bacterium]|nr:hypothetical protein [Cellvibrionaceae bacterium]
MSILLHLNVCYLSIAQLVLGQNLGPLFTEYKLNAMFVVILVVCQLKAAVRWGLNRNIVQRAS